MEWAPIPLSRQSVGRTPLNMGGGGGGGGSTALYDPSVPLGGWGRGAWAFKRRVLARDGQAYYRRSTTDAI